LGSLPRHSLVRSNAIGAGLTLAITVGLFAYGGMWLDTRFGTKPWCLLACVLVGILGGMLHVIRVMAPEMWPFGRRTPKAGRSEQEPPTDSGDEP